MNSRGKIVAIIAAVILLVAAAIVYYKYFFVFGSGVKAGELNQIVYKGWVWKTYEGRLIQTGFKGAKGGGSLQSNEFNFSVVNKKVADSLMRCSGKQVELHYKEYNGMLPWRGMQRYVVDSIICVTPSPSVHTIPIIPEPEDGTISL